MPSILNSLKLASDPTRLRILHVLGKEPLSVAELQEILTMGQSRISSQLSLLKKGGLVTDKRAGKNNIYSCAVSGELLSLLKQAAEEVPEITQDEETLEHILMKRRDQARAYFDKLAGKFGKHYVPGRSWKSLAEGLFRMTNYGVVVDLGAGEGTLSQLLAQYSDRVIAVDHSEKMVEHGSQLAKDHNLKNLEYRLGDLQAPPVEDDSADLVVFSQALHHAISPEKALKKAFALLRPNGKLLILDLAQHNFEQAKELYGDTWLGFAERELAAMTKEAGFSDVTTAIVDREEEAPNFQTLLVTACRIDQ